MSLALSIPDLLVADRSGSRYAAAAQSELRYRGADHSRPLLTALASPDFGSGTWSFARETLDSTFWRWDGSWVP